MLELIINYLIISIIFFILLNTILDVRFEDMEKYNKYYITGLKLKISIFWIIMIPIYLIREVKKWIGELK